MATAAEATAAATAVVMEVERVEVKEVAGMAVERVEVTEEVVMVVAMEVELVAAKEVAVMEVERADGEEVEMVAVVKVVVKAVAAKVEVTVVEVRVEVTVVEVRVEVKVKGSLPSFGQSATAAAAAAVMAAWAASKVYSFRAAAVTKQTAPSTTMPMLSTAFLVPVYRTQSTQDSASRGNKSSWTGLILPWRRDACAWA